MKGRPSASHRWRTSSYSGGTNCVEVAEAGADAVLMRDSKDHGGPVLRFSREAWSAFAGALKSGELTS